MTDSPRSIAEIDKALPSGEDQERFSGYGLMGMPFASGHYLAMRHFPASSLGAGYDSVWHRDPAGEWVIYSSLSPEASCARYFGSALEDQRVEHISITWTGPSAFTVEVPDKLMWDLELGRSVATSAMTGLGRMLPAALWRSPAVLSLMSRVAGPALGVGRVRLSGTSPNGQWFRANPRMLWTVESSRARIDGIDIGPPGPLAEQARLGDFWLPQRGMFVVGEAYFEQYDPARHRAARPGS
ncbi:hypothetical protein [Nocardia sp. NBC_01009]|uniref:hypothetical protein n=1 Tax=Nocardia sp. NBC_01009 TaxID=2975996 RepID=UPI0038670CFD|nr:hypothetical protein OHA42_29520 [Nocardia sp. NBC_01009]